jgi:hypothetical protein
MELDDLLDEFNANISKIREILKANSWEDYGNNSMVSGDSDNIDILLLTGNISLYISDDISHDKIDLLKNILPRYKYSITCKSSIKHRLLEDGFCPFVFYNINTYEAHYVWSDIMQVGNGIISVDGITIAHICNSGYVLHKTILNIIPELGDKWNITVEDTISLVLLIANRLGLIRTSTCKNARIN